MLAILENIFLALVPWLAIITVVIVVHELGHFLVARACGVAVDRFSLGFGKTLFAWRDRSGVEWRLAAIPLGGYVRFAGDAEGSSSVPDAEDLADLKRQIIEKQGPAAVRRYFHFKPLWQRAAVVAAGPFANFVLATVIFAAVLTIFGEMVVRPRIGSVEPGSAAAAAGFRPGDLVTGMDGRPIDNFTDIGRRALFNVGTPIHFTVQRGTGVLDLVATPRAQVRKDIIGGVGRVGYLGLGGSRDRADFSIRKLDPITALSRGGVETWDTLTVNLRYIGRIFRGQESGDQLGGPIRTALLAKAVTESAAASGKTLPEKAEGVAFGLLNLTAFISIAIGFMNLLPIPMLDGGHLAFYGYEAVARKPASTRVQTLSYRVGLALVVCLMLFATRNDLQLPVLKILGGHVS